MLKHKLLVIAFTTIGCASIEELDEPISSEDILASKSGAQDAHAKEDAHIEVIDEQSNEGDAHTEHAAADDGPDACLAFGYYENGVCDTFCRHPDPECELVQQPDETEECQDAQAFPDGHCDLDCETRDPDCDFDDEPWELDEGLMLVCSRFNMPNIVEELAESICIQAPAEHFRTCVETCLMRYENGE